MSLWTKLLANTRQLKLQEVILHVCVSTAEISNQERRGSLISCSFYVLLVRPPAPLHPLLSLKK